MTDKIKIAVFISGGGSNLQAIMDNCKAGKIPGEVVLVVSNKKDAFGLARAEKAGIDNIVFKRNKFATGEEADNFLLQELTGRDVDLIALAGFLKMLPPLVVKRFRGRILNIHPALLPKYGGKGMYGHHVHEAVLASGDMESGVTVHLVDEIYDHGKIIAQVKVPVYPKDTPDELGDRVLEQEHKLYSQVIREIAEKILTEKNESK